MSEIRGLTYCALSDTHSYPMPYQSLSTDLTPYMLCSPEEKAKGLVFGGRLFSEAAADHSGRGVDRNVSSTRNSKSKSDCHIVTKVSYCDHANANSIRAVSVSMFGVWARLDGGRQ